jgi:LuxR family transcriptional regulator, maltose regulon positive regulatory protein
VKQGNGPRLKLSWLGHPRIEQSGIDVRLETRKTTALLAYLSLNQHPQSREKLAALFWPDFDPSRAPANLRRSLASLHASIPGGWLDAERDRIGIRAGAGPWVDVLVVQKTIADLKAHRHEPGRPCAECLSMAVKAIELYRGDFLEGFNLPDCPGFDDWQVEERESLRAALGWLLESSAAGHAAAGCWEEAIRAARRWLGQDRLHEPANALLVRILALSGQRSAAIRHYEEFAEALRAEYGQEPEKGTRELYNEVLERQVGPGEKQNAPGSGAGTPGAQPGGSKREAEAVPSSPVTPPGLLGTKLSVPPVRRGLVRRQRLTSLLEQGLSRGLVIVSAPAGFGKTTILSELAAQAGMPVAWLSLDEGDNDPLRFLLYLAASMVRTGSGDAALQMLMAMPPAPAEMVATAMMNAIQENGERVALMIDDYQFIQAPEVHAVVRFLVDHRPAELAIFIATRADPPFPLARLRSQERVAEIRAEDLRFSPEEAGQFFDTAMSLSLSPAQVAALERRTEGWVAGLQMAALSLQGREDVDGFIASFGGTHRFILDYLAEEVFSRIDEGLRQFLLDTSVLARMSEGLCDAVTGRHGSRETLKQLERMNLFLVPLDEQRSWYRYHHLFSDLLRHKLGTERTAGEILALHVRAGDWFAAQGDLVETMQEYLAAKAHEKAADLIEARYLDIIAQGSLTRLQQWCREIPAQVMECRPGYRVAAAWTLAWVGRRQEAEALLDGVEKSLAGNRRNPAGAAAAVEPDNVRNLEGTAASIRALLCDMAGETARAAELARTAGRLLPPRGDRNLIRYILTSSALFQGELEKANEGCEELLRSAYTDGSVFSICAMVCEMVRLRGLQGRLRDGQALLDEFDAMAVQRHVRGSGQIAKAYALMAEFKREAGRLDEALVLAEKAAKDVDAWGLPSDVYITHQFLARVLRTRGELAQAEEEMAKYRSLPERALVWATLLPGFETDRVRIWLRRGDIASAQAWVREYRPGKAEALVNRELELITLARIRLAAGLEEGEGMETVRLLEELAGSARAGGRWGALIAILVLQARARGRFSGPENALESLREAVSLAQPQGYFNVFVEEGPEILALFRRGQELRMWDHSPAREYVAGLVAGPGA